jgi:hypothetical protein
MKAVVESGLVSGSLFGAAWIVILSPAFIAFAIMGHLVPSIAVAAFIFVLAGLSFGLGMGLFVAYQRRRFLAEHLVPDDESLLHQGGANHFVGVEGVGGWLYLTDRALWFKSHEINIQRHKLEIPLTQIYTIVPCRSAWVIPNALVVHTHDGRSERFVVTGRRTWSSAIAKARISAVQVGPADNYSSPP